MFVHFGQISKNVSIFRQLGLFANAQSARKMHKYFIISLIFIFDRIWNELANELSQNRSSDP